VNESRFVTVETKHLNTQSHYLTSLLASPAIRALRYDFAPHSDDESTYS